MAADHLGHNSPDSYHLVKQREHPDPTSDVELSTTVKATTSTLNSAWDRRETAPVMGPDHVLQDCPQYTAGRVKSLTTSTALDTKLNGVLADLKAALVVMEETGLARTCEKRLRKKKRTQSTLCCADF